MKTLVLCQLNEIQKSEVNELIEICLNFDHLERTLYLENDLNYYEDLKSFYLLYDDKKLVSMLTIYQPNKNDVELSAYTLPTERRKGYFKKLLKCAFNELNSFQISHKVFVVEPNSKSGNGVMHSLNACYEKSEYLLTFDLDQELKQEQITEHGFTIIEMDLNTIQNAIEINIETLNTDPIEAQYMFQQILEAEDLICYCALYNEVIIGICCVSFGNSSASIFALGVKKIYQGSGYGRKLLMNVINRIKDKKFNTVSLQVGSESKEAFSLYKSINFQIKTQYDYYLI